MVKEACSICTRALIILNDVKTQKQSPSITIISKMKRSNYFTIVNSIKARLSILHIFKKRKKFYVQINFISIIFDIFI